MALYNYSGLVL